MESALDFHTAKALLDWQVELGVTEAILDAPVNRYDLPDKARKPAAPTVEDKHAPIVQPKIDPAAVAREVAESAGSIEALAQALAGFDHCDLRHGARNLVFAHGRPGARVMIIDKPPTRDEDLAGHPFAGAAGGLLDKMLAAIGLSREAPDLENAVYLTSVVPWRTLGDGDPSAEDLACLAPFLRRHITLAAPEIVVVMDNVAAQVLLGRKGISRMRGTWTKGLDLPVMPMLHPERLMKEPMLKRDAWADLLEIRARLDAPTKV